MYYQESQKFKQWWLWVILTMSIVPMLGMLTFGFFRQIVAGIPWGSKPMSDQGLIAVTVLVWGLCIGIVYLIATLRLNIAIRDKAIFVQFPPLFNREKRFGKEDIQSWHVRSFRPISEFGGYGIRGLIFKRGYIVSGKMGVDLKFNSGKRLFISLENPSKASMALRRELEGKEWGQMASENLADRESSF